MKKILVLLSLFIAVFVTTIACEPQEEEIGVTSVSINPSDIQMEIGESAQLNVSVVPTNATNKSVIWSSSMQSVVTVTQEGRINAISEGSATITATAGGKSGICKVTVLPAKPVLEVSCLTGESTSITHSTVTISGSATISGAQESSAKVYFHYSSIATDAASLKKDGKLVDAGTIPNYGGKFNATVTNLEPETKYYYIATVIIDGNETSGRVSSFTTAAKPKELTITGDVSNITELSAVLTGYVNATPDLINPSWGLIISINENPTLEDTVPGSTWDSQGYIGHLSLDENNMYRWEVSHLSSNTVYYYRSIVKYGDEYKLGEIKSFKTLEISADIKTLSATDIDLYSATFNGSIKFESVAELTTDAGFLCGKGTTIEEIQNNLVYSVWAQVLDDGSFSYSTNNNMNHLDPNTQYHFVAYAKIYDKVFYGDIISFSTDAFQVTVIANDANDVAPLSAGLSGHLSIENKDPFTSTTTVSVGFLYGTKNDINDLKKNGTELCVKNQRSINLDFEYIITDLIPNTTYYYIAIAKVDSLVFYSETLKSFTTKDIELTLKMSDIELFSAMFEAELFMDGKNYYSYGYNPIEYFYYYGKESSIESLIANGIKLKDTDYYSANNQKSIGKLSNLTSGTTYNIVAWARVWYSKELNIYWDVYNIISFTTKKESDYGEAVDLGLSVKWRSCNLGATSNMDLGSLFAWGEIETKQSFDWSSYSLCNAQNNDLKKYNTLPSVGYVDNKTELERQDDAATAKLGGKWRMPTAKEWQELIDNCTWKKQSGGGYSGYLFTSKKNGKSILILYSDSSRSQGFYWSSSLVPDIPQCAKCLKIDGMAGTGHEYPYVEIVNKNRCLGLPIRPVTE